MVELKWFWMTRCSAVGFLTNCKYSVIRFLISCFILIFRTISCSAMETSLVNMWNESSFVVPVDLSSLDGRNYVASFMSVIPFVYFTTIVNNSNFMLLK